MGSGGLGVSWGMSVARDDADGIYHAFINVMANGSGLGAWETASEVVHAVAASPEGPFELRETVLPSFHHNARLARAPDGTHLLFSIGQGQAHRHEYTVNRPGIHFASHLSG